jgi:hypothetical protein
MEPSQELRDLIAGWFQAVERGDASWADRYVSRQSGARIVGTDPNEWMDGEQGAAFLSEEARALGGQVKVEMSDLEAFREGSVGWGIARPTITLPNGNQFSPRWAAVFHQENGEWRIVQLHASAGIPNEEVLG